MDGGTVSPGGGFRVERSKWAKRWTAHAGHGVDYGHPHHRPASKLSGDLWGSGVATGQVKLDGSVGEGGGQILRTALDAVAVDGPAVSDGADPGQPGEAWAEGAACGGGAGGGQVVRGRGERGGSGLVTAGLPARGGRGGRPGAQHRHGGLDEPGVADSGAAAGDAGTRPGCGSRWWGGRLTPRRSATRFWRTRGRAT